MYYVKYTKDQKRSHIKPCSYKKYYFVRSFSNIYATCYSNVICFVIIQRYYSDFSISNLQILAKECFQHLTRGCDPFFEDSHERILLLMGTGQMSDPNCAPTDPVFWLHTAFMDHIWERFRGSQNFVTRELEYPLENLGN